MKPTSPTPTSVVLTFVKETWRTRFLRVPTLERPISSERCYEERILDLPI